MKRIIGPIIFMVGGLKMYNWSCVLEHRNKGVNKWINTKYVIIQTRNHCRSIEI